MKLSFATLGCPAWTVPQIARNAAAMGFDGVELRGVPGEHIGPRESDAGCRAIRDLFAQFKLAIPCIMGYSHFTTSDQAKRQQSEQDILDMIGTAQKVGCPTIRIFGGAVAADGRPASLGRFVGSLGKVLPRAESAGVRLAIETHDDWCRGEQVREVLDRVKSGALGVCWDMGNSHDVEPVEKTAGLIGDRLFHVHFKDNVPGPNGHHKSVLPGKGNVPAKRALAALKKVGYAGFISFEWEKKWEPDLEEPEVALPAFVNYMRSI